MGQELTRRSFLTGAAAACSGAALLGMAGCSQPKSTLGNTGSSGSSSKTESEKRLWSDVLEEVSESDVDATEEVDAVVVGSGTAGTFAAVRLAEQGARVLWIEKTSLKGGTSTVTEASAVPDCKMQLDAFGKTDREALFNVIQDWHQWGALPDAIWSHFDNGAKAVDWACDHGAKLQFMGTADSPSIMCFGEDGKWISMGEGLLTPLWSYGETMDNLDFRLETACVGLVKDGDAVMGIYARDASGKLLKVNAKAVVLATGGFGCNEAMLDQYLRVRTDRVKLLGFDGQTGDGINLAIAAGAAMHAPSALMYGLTHVIGTAWDDMMNIAILWPAQLTSAVVDLKATPVVNEYAERFYNESAGCMAMSTPFNIATAAQSKTFAIFDENRVKVFDGLEEFDYFTGISKGSLREELGQCEYIYKADTIEELAGLIGLDPQALTATINEYNDIADGKAADGFGSNKDMMARIDTAPFYAAETEACAYSTCGGIKANYDCVALDPQGNPIEGLYVCGLDNGSLYYNDYPYGVYGGSGQGSATSNGFAAAEAIARGLKS